MARINIDASAALAEWVDLFRADQDQRLYFKLVDRAVCYLPMPERKPKLDFNEFLELANPEISAKLLDACAAAYLETARAMRSVSPPATSKMLTNHAWRNGPMEEIHAGAFREYPLDQPRITPADERKLMGFAGERLALGHENMPAVLGRATTARLVRASVPYALAGMLLITPSGWILTESSRPIRLLKGASPALSYEFLCAAVPPRRVPCVPMVRDVIGCLDAHATCLNSSSSDNRTFSLRRFGSFIEGLR